MGKNVRWNECSEIGWIGKLVKLYVKWKENADERMRVGIKRGIELMEVH